MMLAFVIGVLGGAWHLTATAIRARRFTTGSVLSAMVLLPIAMVGPIAAVVFVAKTNPAWVWAVLPGLFVARLLFLRPLEARLGEVRWTP